jgi:hypothetical protein
MRRETSSGVTPSVVVGHPDAQRQLGQLLALAVTAGESPTEAIARVVFLLLPGTVLFALFVGLIRIVALAR